MRHPVDIKNMRRMLVFVTCHVKQISPRSDNGKLVCLKDETLGDADSNAEMDNK